MGIRDDNGATISRSNKHLAWLSPPLETRPGNERDLICTFIRGEEKGEEARVVVGDLVRTQAILTLCSVIETTFGQHLWDLDEGVCFQILRGHRGIVFAYALSEDARFAVSGSEDMIVRLWDLVQGKLLFTFAASSAVISCDISSDGSVAIAAES